MVGSSEPPIPRPSAGAAFTAPMHATALALGDVVFDQISCSNCVCLQRQVVISDLLTLALNDLENAVSSFLDLLVELDLEESLGVLEMLGDALLNSFSLCLTDADSTVKSLVQVCLHHISLFLDQFPICSRCLRVVVHDTSQVSETVLGSLGISGDSVGEHDNLGVESFLGTSQLVC